MRRIQVVRCGRPNETDPVFSRGVRDLYRGLRISAVVPALNEEARIERVIGRVDPTLVDALIVVDDGSTDRTAQLARQAGAQVVSHHKKRGVGAALRLGLNLARRDGCDVPVIVAGNGKDDPREMPRLIDPILDESVDLVVGSRFAPGGH